jgi:PAS domain S-box-containing protein
MTFSTRADGSNESCNALWHDYTGLSKDGADREAWRTCIHPDDRGAIFRNWTASLKTGEPYNAEYRLRHASGQFRWVIAQARAERDSSGDILRWLGAITDIHDLKTAQHELAAKEAQLRDWNEALEQRVAALGAQLADVQAALRQSQKLDAMGQITSGVVHDFNNLLTPILGGLEIIQQRGVGAGDQRMQRAISGSISSAERARALVQRLLAFARRQPLQAVPVNLSAMMADMEQLLSTTLSSRVRLRIDAPSSLPCVQADLNQLEVAILNLAVNARDAMPKGGELRIDAKLVCVVRRDEAGVKPGYYVRMSIADTGCGMDDETRARAIEPFFTTKGVGHGTGLGLSMAHELVTQLGGMMTIDSAPGAGTTITLLLPTANTPPTR